MLLNLATVGGTFDLLHRGHKELLRVAFLSAKRVIIGLSSDEFCSSRGKKPLWDYARREQALRGYLENELHVTPERYSIVRLDEAFGPAATLRELEGIVVSTETKPVAEEINKVRSRVGLPPLKIIEVPLVLADDGLPISSTRIRAGIIDAEGKLVGRGLQRA